jgi:hypothetical protein
MHEERKLDLAAAEQIQLHQQEAFSKPNFGNVCNLPMLSGTNTYSQN